MGEAKVTIKMSGVMVSNLLRPPTVKPTLVPESDSTWDLGIGRLGDLGKEKRDVHEPFFRTGGGRQSKQTTVSETQKSKAPTTHKQQKGSDGESDIKIQLTNFLLDF